MKTIAVVVLLMLAAGTGWAGETKLCDNFGNCWSLSDAVPQTMTLECNPVKCPGSYYQPDNTYLVGPCDELRAAAEGVLPYLRKSDEVITENSVYYTPAMRLRMEAERMENRDAAIQRLRDALRGITLTAPPAPGSRRP
jgi:hypothetical protein